MGFIRNGSKFISFASPNDVRLINTRIFEANESLDDDSIGEQLKRSSATILNSIRTSTWWVSAIQRSTEGSKIVVNVNSNAIAAPALDPTLIIGRYADFTDLAVFHCLYNYILPKIADFGNPDSAEAKQIGLYTKKYDDLLASLLADGNWYDFDKSGFITPNDERPYPVNRVRIR